MDAAVVEIARLVKSAGGRALLVGGCVRDGLLGGDPKDFDLEVYGLAPERLRETLERRFALDFVGASFGVIKVKGHDIDVAMPRRETKLGLGHRAFETECDPTLTLEEASARRDFTVNAIYRDPLTDKILDPWRGREDLGRKILRHVSSHFAEDPLRVLRGMQFIARFGLDAAPETVVVCRGMTPEGLAQERLMGEWSKLLLQGRFISRGLGFLREVGWVKYYPELERLIGCEQDPEWHPEGDVWNHTLECLDRFANERENPIAQPPSSDLRTDANDLIVGLAVLCHDFGKPDCTRYDPVKKRIRSLGHDDAGVAPTLSFLRRLTNEERILKEVPQLVRLHMRPFAMWRDKSSDGAIRRLATQVPSIESLVRVAAADTTLPEACEWLLREARRLEVEAAAPKPLVKGRDLIARGMKPGPRFGTILNAAYEAQLEGRFATVEEGLAYLESELPACAVPRTAPRNRYILWDWNGTLLDDTDACVETLNIMLRRRGKREVTREFFRDNFVFPARNFYRLVGMDVPDDEWDALAAEYHELYAAQPKRLNVETMSVLSEVRRLGIGQSIISALRQDLLEKITSELGVAPYMQYLYGVDNLDGGSKIGRARELLSRLENVEPVMIGDSLHDKEVADALGVRCVLCSQGSHSHARLAAVAPTGATLSETVNLALGGLQ